MSVRADWMGGKGTTSPSMHQQVSLMNSTPNSLSVSACPAASACSSTNRDRVAMTRTSRCFAPPPPPTIAASDLTSEKERCGLPRATRSTPLQSPPPLPPSPPPPPPSPQLPPSSCPPLEGAPLSRVRQADAKCSGDSRSVSTPSPLPAAPRAVCKSAASGVTPTMWKRAAAPEVPKAAAKALSSSRVGRRWAMPVRAGTRVCARLPQA
mmetsp:Transcript_34255/g.101840  ORF Transcript_34255/g.101840 Transcript_34255/m.101840 type:complete len:209 (+) Transcript_34255:915-1541(+)